MTQSKKTHLPASNGLEPMWGEPLPKVPTQKELLEMDIADLRDKFPGQPITVYATPVEQEHIGDWVHGAGVIIEEDRSEALPDSVDRTVVACYDAAHELGWHKSWERLQRDVQNGAALEDFAPRTEEDVANWISSKLLLVVSEIVEAQDELRNGRDILDVYYRDVEGHFGEPGKTFPEQKYAEEDDRPLLKPEGFLVEVADAYIRICDLVGVTIAEGVSFGAIVEGKLLYNATRGVMHGGKKF